MHTGQINEIYIMSVWLSCSEDVDDRPEDVISKDTEENKFFACDNIIFVSSAYTLSTIFMWESMNINIFITNNTMQLI